jgi:prevent-host-death family protein
MDSCALTGPCGPRAGMYGSDMETYPLVEAQNRLRQLIGRVRHAHERIVISEHGRPAAVLIPMMEELDELRRLRDAADIAEAASREAASGGPAMTHGAFMAQLETEDRGAAAP